MKYSVQKIIKIPMVIETASETMCSLFCQFLKTDEYIDQYTCSLFDEVLEHDGAESDNDLEISRCVQCLRYE